MLKEKIPILQIKKEFAKQILDGSKKIEYRDFTDHNIKLFSIGEEIDNSIKKVKFVNGYRKDRLEFECEVLSIEFLEFADDEGNFTDDEGGGDLVFALHLGTISNIKNNIF
jgi:hypothetical protein